MDSLIMTSDSGLYYIIKYGDQMRAGIDIGILAVENNGKLSGLYMDNPESFFFAVFEPVESEACSN
jgi:hypothetical protein